MVDAGGIREGMEVVGNDGRHVGVVDRVEGRQIKLSIDDPTAKGVHTYVDPRNVASVDDRVRLAVPKLVALGAVQDTPGAPGATPCPRFPRA